MTRDPFQQKPFLHNMTYLTMYKVATWKYQTC